jgi:hypothetical protein
MNKITKERIHNNLIGFTKRLAEAKKEEQIIDFVENTINTYSGYIEEVVEEAISFSKLDVWKEIGRIISSNHSDNYILTYIKTKVASELRPFPNETNRKGDFS